MKRIASYPVLVILILLALIVTACAPNQPAATQPPVQESTQPPVEEVDQPPAEEPAQPTVEEAAQPTVEDPEQPSEEKVVIRVMDNWGTAGDTKSGPLLSIFDGFMEEYPNIVIQEEVYADTEIPTKVETAFLAGEEPDLVFHNYPYGGTDDWLDSDVAIDVLPYMEQWGLKDLFKEVALQQYTDTQGRMVAFPLEGFTWPMWYNMKILKEAGVDAPPKTIDELIDAAGKVRAAGYQPLVIGGSDWTGQAFFNLVNTTLMTNQEFGDVFRSGEFSKSESFVKSVELFTRLRDEGVFADNAEGVEFATMNEAFFSGKAAMMHAGSWSFGEPPEEIVQDVIVTGFPLPEGSPHTQPIVGSGFYGKGIWITRSGAQKLDAVEKFVKYFYIKENITPFVEESGMTSPLKDTPFDDSKLFPLFLQSLSWGDTITYVDIVDPYVPGTAWEDLTKVTMEAFLPGTPADKIVADLEAAWALHK